ncbi:MAG: hypothetical protein H6839_08735 [Planctomycetes bacterium]|nr:hypothetical protein [Planctomycetota bacterium]
MSKKPRDKSPTEKSTPDGKSGSMLDDFENSLESAVSDVPNVGQHPNGRKTIGERLDAAQREVDTAEKETAAADKALRKKRGSPAN